MNSSAAPLELPSFDTPVIRTIIDELTAFPTVSEDAPSRMLTIPEQSLLHEWVELYWQSLERSDFLDWASAFDIDLDTFNLKSDTLHASTLRDGVTVTKTFTLEDDSGWWRVATPILSIARKIDPWGQGLPYVGGKSANPLYQFPRRIVLEFHGYPEPENRMQAQVIINELTTTGLPRIGSDAHTTSALVAERAAQLRDLSAIADALEHSLNAREQLKLPYDRLKVAETRIRPRDGSFLTTAMKHAARALSAVVTDPQFLAAAGDAAEFESCRYSAQKQTFYLISRSGTLTEYLQSAVPDTLATDLVNALTVAAQTLGTDVASDHFFNLDQLLNCYGFALPETLAGAREQVIRLRQKTWLPLPSVNEFIQTRESIAYLQQVFADAEDYRHIARSLKSLGKRRADSEAISLQALGTPETRSSLSKAIEAGRRQLKQLRASPELQRLLKRNRLPARCSLLLKASGQLRAVSSEDDPSGTVLDIDNQGSLRPFITRLKPLALAAGGVIRTDGRADLQQMLTFYEIPLPKTAGDGRIISQWTTPNQRLSAGYMDYWYLLGQPGTSAKGLSTRQRQLIIDTTQAFLAHSAKPLIDHLCGSLTDQLDVITIQTKADSLIGRLLITPQAHALGNRLLDKLTSESTMTKELRAINRERLVLTALILSLDPEAGKHPHKMIDHPLDDSFFWGEPLPEVRRFITGQLALQSINNKTLASHLLLSGIAAVFLVRDIPASLAYMSSYRWVKLTQVVTYIERRAPGTSRLMTYTELMTLAMHPVIPHVEDIRTQSASQVAMVDWAVARGLMPADSRTRPENTATLNKARTAFVEHSLQMFNHVELAFRKPFPTPYSLALADLRKVFADHYFLEEKCLQAPISAEGDSTQAVSSAGTEAAYSLVELHIARQLTPGAQEWHCTHPDLQWAQLAPKFAQLSPVAEQFVPQRDARLGRMKAALIAMLKELFCELPLQQRLDLEQGTLNLFTLHPVPADFTEPPSGSDWNVPAGPHGIIVSCQSATPRLYEVIVRDTAVVLRRDIDPSKVLPVNDDNVPRELPFDSQAYLQGVRSKRQGTCRGLLKRLDIQGAPLAKNLSAQVPATFNSPRIDAIARTAVKQLFDAYETTALKRLEPAPDLSGAAQSHQAWLTFYQALTALGV